MFNRKNRLAAILLSAIVFCQSVTVQAAYNHTDSVEEFREVLELIDAVYYYGEQVDYKELTDAALKAVFDNLDKYSKYMTLDEYNDFHMYAETNMSGIGVLLRKNGKGYAEIMKVYKGSPAERAGLLKGDTIQKINGADVVNKDLNEIRNVIIGTTGSSVKLTILRDGKTTEISATRGTFVTPLAERTKISELIEGADDSKTAYVEISSFAHNVKDPLKDTAKQFLQIYKDIKKENIKNLIIDLRNNSGGDVAALIEIAEVLVRTGTLFTFKYSSEEPDVYKTVSSAPEFNVAVLVNENTASSSEILASAIKESNSGIIVGTNTYGKGVGQVPLPASDGKHMILITVTEIISRNGNTINGVGVKPDIYVKPAPWILADKPIDAQSSASQVAALRNALTYLGYYASVGNQYDASLISAVKSFQKDLGLPETGLCDLYLIGRINDNISDKAQLSDETLQRAYQELNK